jgi:hypothetical protein
MYVSEGCVNSFLHSFRFKSLFHTSFLHRVQWRLFTTVICGLANLSTLLARMVDPGMFARLVPDSLDVVVAVSTHAVRRRVAHKRTSSRRASTSPSMARFRTKLAAPTAIGTLVLEQIQLSWVAVRAILARADVRRRISVPQV